MTAKPASEAFCRIEVRARDRGDAERVAADAFEAGIVGLEEREGDRGVILLLYAPAAAGEGICTVLQREYPAVWVDLPRRVPETDWSEQWKAGLKPLEISPRLLVRPSFAQASPRAGQAQLVIDPGQAFGTGGHPSTQLALEWIDALARSWKPGARVLDVGTGTGILSLAALRLGEAKVVAFDLDSRAIEAARDNARINGLEAGFSLYRGTLDALALVEFDLVVANLLRTELLPLVAGIAARIRPGGHAVFAGLLREECDVMKAAARSAQLALVGVREGSDAGGDCWSALLMSR